MTKPVEDTSSLVVRSAVYGPSSSLASVAAALCLVWVVPFPERSPVPAGSVLKKRILSFSPCAGASVHF